MAGGKSGYAPIFTHAWGEGLKGAGPCVQFSRRPPRAPREEEGQTVVAARRSYWPPSAPPPPAGSCPQSHGNGQPGQC